MATDRVIVQFKKDVVLAMAAEEQGLQFQKPAGLQGALVYTIRDNSTVEEKIEQLSHHPGARGARAPPVAALSCCCSILHVLVRGGEQARKPREAGELSNQRLGQRCVRL